MSFDSLETGITLNGVPLERLGKNDMLHLAELMNINLECDLDDRMSVIALIDNGFLRIKNRNIVDAFCVVFAVNCRNWPKPIPIDLEHTENAMSESEQHDQEEIADVSQDSSDQEQRKSQSVLLSEISSDDRHLLEFDVELSSLSNSLDITPLAHKSDSPADSSDHSVGYIENGNSNVFSESLGEYQESEVDLLDHSDAIPSINHKESPPGEEVVSDVASSQESVQELADSKSDANESEQEDGNKGPSEPDESSHPIEIESISSSDSCSVSSHQSQSDLAPDSSDASANMEIEHHSDDSHSNDSAQSHSEAVDSVASSNSEMDSESLVESLSAKERIRQKHLELVVQQNKILFDLLEKHKQEMNEKRHNFVFSESNSDYPDLDHVAAHHYFFSECDVPLTSRCVLSEVTDDNTNHLLDEDNREYDFSEAGYVSPSSNQDKDQLSTESVMTSLFSSVSQIINNTDTAAKEVLNITSVESEASSTNDEICVKESEWNMSDWSDDVIESAGDSTSSRSGSSTVSEYESPAMIHPEKMEPLNKNEDELVVVDVCDSDNGSVVKSNEDSNTEHVLSDNVVSSSPKEPEIGMEEMDIKETEDNSHIEVSNTCVQQKSSSREDEVPYTSIDSSPDNSPTLEVPCLETADESTSSNVSLPTSHPETPSVDLSRTVTHEYSDDIFKPRFSIQQIDAILKPFSDSVSLSEKYRANREAELKLLRLLPAKFTHRIKMYYYLIISNTTINS